MRTRILNLDGSLLLQPDLLAKYRPEVLQLEEYAPYVRLGCSFGRYRHFEQALARVAGSEADTEPWITLYGSGDFHHVSLALLRRLTGPFNLAVFDNHPDWMRGVPLMHCGTWLYHAARLPQVQRIFHIGGDVDFDNYYRWLAPWRLLASGKIVVFPARRQYQRGKWPKVKHVPVHCHRKDFVSRGPWEHLLSPFAKDLRRWPLYISLDKDVMVATDAAVNWDSGHLTLTEACDGLRCLGDLASGRLAGMDIVGDCSPVRVRGLARWFMHVTEHPALSDDAGEASKRNQHSNLTLLAAIAKNSLTSCGH